MKEQHKIGSGVVLGPVEVMITELQNKEGGQK